MTKALEPHVSGTFAEGHTGSKYNAGMGLFFISDRARRDQPGYPALAATPH